jgi:hypothetical protein
MKGGENLDSVAAHCIGSLICAKPLRAGRAGTVNARLLLRWMLVSANPS